MDDITLYHRASYETTDFRGEGLVGYGVNDQQHLHGHAFGEALEFQGLLGPDGRPIRRSDSDQGPVLVAWSDNGPEKTAGDTRTFMALMTIVQHHGRPHTPTEQANIESFFDRLNGNGPTSNTSRTPPASTPNSTGSEANTTRSGCTKPSGMSPPTTSTTAWALPSAEPAPQE